MNALVVPAARARWEVKEIPTPEPGPNQVLIKIKASGLCFTDVHITHGMIPTQFPRTLGHEPVGEIVELGEGVTKRKVAIASECRGLRTRPDDANGACAARNSFASKASAPAIR